MVPSQLAASTGRPERFLHLHFATPVWQHNIAEIMAHPHTDPAVFEALIAFSRQMGMVPIPLKKEQPGAMSLMPCSFPSCWRLSNYLEMAWRIIN
jgi:3-hydroxyacyl-CoA dehydrogenase